MSYYQGTAVNLNSTSPKNASVSLGSGSLGNASYSYPIIQGTSLQNSPYNQQVGGTLGGSSGGGSIQGASTVYQDPYAKYGGQTAFNNLMSGFDAQKSSIFNSANEAAGASGSKLQGSILDFISSLRQGQKSVDSSAINNILAKLQGQAGVQNMVGQGIKSGYTMLGNRNAGDSSASEGLARAYSEVGNREMRNVGNQYATNEREVQNQQGMLDDQRASGMRQLNQSKEDTINNIVNDARRSLADLDIKMLEADMPTRIAIEQEKNAIKTAITAQLQQYDAMLRDQAAGIKASTFDQRQAEATRMQSEGYDLGDKAFNFTSSIPAQLRNTGPFSSGLPIFSNRYRQED